MALVKDKYRLQATFGGLDDSTQDMTGEMTAATFAVASTDAALVLTAWGGVSAGVIKGYSITERWIEDNYSRPTSQDAEGGEKATVTVQIEGNPFKTATISIPFPVIGLFLNTVGQNRNVIDTSDSALLILVNKYSTGGQLYISDGEVAEGILHGMRS